MDKTMLISPEYAALNTRLHQDNAAYGTSGQRWAKVVADLAAMIATQDILDYGCGKQTLQAALPQFKLKLYDPAVSNLSQAPQLADFAVCTDVLEHVEPELVDNVLDDLQRVTGKIGLFTVATRPAVKILADGRNAHLTIESIDWWLAKFKSRFHVHASVDYGGSEFFVIVSRLNWPLSEQKQTLHVQVHGQAMDIALPFMVAATAAAEDGDEASLRERLHLHPDDADAMLALGQLLKQKKAGISPPLTPATNSQPTAGEGLLGVNMYGDSVAIQPQSPGVAMANPGIEAFMRGDWEAAISVFEQQTASSPMDASAWHNLGLARLNAQRFSGAEQALLHALKLRPDYAKAANSMVALMLGQSRFAEAQKFAEQACQLDPSGAAPFHNLGLVASRQQRWDDAAQAFMQAMVNGDQTAQNIRQLSFAYQGQRLYDKASACLELLLQKYPGEGEDWWRLGRMYYMRDKFADALPALLKASQSNPSSSEYVVGLAEVLVELNRADEAVRLLDMLHQQGNLDVVGLCALGVALERMDALLESVAVFREAIAKDSAYPNSYLNLGRVLDRAGDFEGAWQVNSDLAKREPNNYRAQYNLGAVAYQLGRWSVAEVHYRRAIELEPTLQLAWHNQAMLMLAQWRWQEGWSSYQWRSNRFEYEGCISQWQPHTQILPQALSDQVVRVRGEQGIGDELFFARYIPLLQARGARVEYILNPNSAAKMPALLQAMLPGMAQISWQAAPNDGAIDLALGDLPYALQAFEQAPAALPIKVDAQISAQLRQDWLDGLGAKPKIGITWRAGSNQSKFTLNYQLRLSKEIPLADFLAACHGIDAVFIILQRNPEPQELQIVADILGDKVLDCSDLNEDLPTMVALIAELDLLLGVSNTNFHLAACLNKPGMVLQPHPPEFRWGLSGNSPWFPACEVYRQSMAGDWQQALQAVREQLFERFGVRQA